MNKPQQQGAFVKENIIAVLGSLAFTGIISSTAAYADDVQLDVNQISKIMSSCQMLYGNKAHCDKDVVNKCEAQENSADCQTLIRQARALPVNQNMETVEDTTVIK